MSTHTESDPSLSGMLGAAAPEHGFRGGSLMVAIAGFGAALCLLLVTPSGSTRSDRCWGVARAW